MKATFFTREFPPYIYGGAGVHVDQLTKFLSHHIEVDVRCFGDQRMTGSNLTATGYSTNLKTDPSAPVGAKVLPIIATDLAMVAQPIDSDILHCHTWYSMAAGAVGRMLYHRPLVVTAHSLEPLRPWKEEQLGSGYTLSSWLEKTGFVSADRVIAVSQEMRRDILSVYPIPSERVEVVHNGIDPDTYRYTEQRDYPDSLGLGDYLLFVGRISRQKGIFSLLDAFSQLNDLNVKLVLCASSPDEPEILSEMEERLKYQPNCIWLNEMVSKEKVIQLYSHAKAFVCPSVYEPFGIINLEAMACGTPVVASRVGGIPEVIVEGETGLMVQPGEPGPLAEAIRRILTRPEWSRELGANGRIRAEREFSWDVIARRTVDLYQRTCEDFRKTSGNL